MKRCKSVNTRQHIHLQHNQFRAKSWLIVFAVSLLIFGCGNPGHTSGKVKPTATPVTPTATPDPTPLNYATLPTAAQVWGAKAVPTTFSLPGSMQVDGISADGAKLMGWRFSADGKTYLIGWENVAPHTFTTITTEPLVNSTGGDGYENTPPFCCVSDGRYYVGTFGGLVKSPNTLWYYDTSNGQVRTLVHIPIEPQELLWVVNGVLTYEFDPGTDPNPLGVQLKQMNLATGESALAPHPLPSPEIGLNSYPYVMLLYPKGTTPSFELFNTVTGQDTDISRFDDESSMTNGLLVGDSLYFMQPIASKSSTYVFIAVSHATDPASQLVNIAYLPESFVHGSGGNQRLIGFGILTPCFRSQCSYAVAWDLVLHKLVLLSDPTHNALDYRVFTSGNYMAVIYQSGQPTAQATVYDTETLPTT